MSVHGPDRRDPARPPGQKDPYHHCWKAPEGYLRASSGALRTSWQSAANYLKVRALKSCKEQPCPGSTIRHFSCTEQRKPPAGDNRSSLCPPKPWTHPSDEENSGATV